MKSRQGPRSGTVIALIVSFCAGGLVGWWLHAGPPRPAPVNTAEARRSEPREDAAAARSSAPAGGFGAVATMGDSEPQDAIEELRGHDLRLPIDGIDVESLKGGFDQARAGGRPHEAVDMLAPRNTPVHAVEDGTIAKLFVSDAGGNTIYQFDPSGRFCYYYAHLDHYASGLRDGAAVRRGDVIGFVGTSGNAPPDTPHLHFAVFELGAERHWWEGKAIDPYLVFR